MTSFSIGRKAEAQAAQVIKQRGFKLIAQNWRNRWCEIDLIACKDGCVYFIEVKYRHNSVQGSGFEYITPKKLRQMHFAAEFWISENNWTGECSLGAVGVTGHDFQVTNFITSVY